MSSSVMWNPWHGCHKVSEGCLNCYMYSQDKQYGIDSSIIKRSKTQFDLPLKRDKFCNYKIPEGTLVETCFTSDFFLEEADNWRSEALQIIEERQDLVFVIPTKRIERVREVLDFSKSYSNVVIAVSCENQKRFQERVKVLKNIPKNFILARILFCSPLLEAINLSEAFSDETKVDGVYVAGENYIGARPCRYEWVQSMYAQCVKANVNFQFWDIGSNFWKDGKQYRVISSKVRKEQARKSGLTYGYNFW